MSQFGVYPVNTTDTDLKQRFNSDNPIGLFNGKEMHVQYFYYKWDDIEFGNPKVCSHLRIYAMMLRVAYIALIVGKSDEPDKYAFDSKVKVVCVCFNVACTKYSSSVRDEITW